MNTIVNFDKALDFTTQVIKAGLVPYLAGDPGIGKSAIAHRIGKMFNLEVIDIRLSQEDPTILNGLPNFEAGRTVFHPPKRFPLEGDAVPEGKAGWLIMFDELPSAPRSVQASSYKIILDRMIGEKPLHKKVAIIAAGNLITSGAIVNEMGTALRSRMVHISMGSDTKSWLQHARDKVDSRILAYLNYQTGSMNTFEGFEKSQDATFACERTWTFASKILGQVSPDQTKPVNREYTDLLAGTVGSIAYEFVTFCEAFNQLPTLAEVVAKPTECKLPDAAAASFLLTGMLSNQITVDNAKAICTYLTRLPLEFQLVFASMAWKRDAELLMVPEFSAIVDKVAGVVYG